MNNKVYTLIQLSCKSISDAIYNKSNINPDVLNVRGMSTPKVRHLINNICYNLSIQKECNYLEVGSFRGSTLCSAISNNNIKNAYAFENFSEFHDQQDKNELFANINKFKDNVNVQVIEDDFFTTNLDKIRDIDVYLYDGNHSDSAQYFNFQKIKDSLSNESIVIVDDWLSGTCAPRNPTFQALKDFGYYINFFTELPKIEFHDALGLFVVSK